MGWVPSAMIATVLAFVVLGGCVEKEQERIPDNEAPILAPPPLSMEWGLKSCKSAAAIVDVDAAKVQPHVPPGFTIMSMPQVAAAAGGAPLAPPNPRGNGNFGIEMFVCEDGVGLNESVKLYGSLFTAVIPPPELRVEGVNMNFVKWDVLIPDEARRERLIAAGVPAKDGTAEFPLWVPGPVYAFEGSMKLGEETYQFSGGGGAVAPEGSFVEYSQTPTGFVFWKTDYKTDETRVGPIDVTVPQTGLAAAVLGPGVHHAAGFLGISQFENGSISETKPE